MVALSVVAVVLAAIGSLIGGNSRAVRTSEERLTRLEIARAIMTALPERNELVSGISSGTMAGHPWMVQVAPFRTAGISQNLAAQWVPQAVLVTVQSPSGAALQINTIRLQRKARQ
jgi:general secretion pathway protein I